MKNLTIQNLVKATQGKFYGDESILYKEVTGVFTDSRKICEGSLFIPIVGARVDGHSFISKVFEMGALCTLSEKELENPDGPYVLVESSLKAIRDIAEFYLSQLDVKVVGVTGSVGKTSTKEMIASVLSKSFNILKTEGNFNNEIGLPLTVFRLTGEEDIAVLEMGISDFGEMSRLTKIARPDVAVITNIGLCHLENLKTRDGILKAKTEIFEGLKSDGKICLNGDDDKLINVKTAKCEADSIIKNNKLIYFGKADNNNIYAKNIKSLGLKGTECTICTDIGEITVKIPVPGVHMVYNALAACSVGRCFDMPLEKIKEGIEALRPVNGRVNMIDTEKFTIIDDCYNANPVSMKSSIDILEYATGRKVCILGDMFELGENEKKLHQQVGEHICKCSIDVLITIGNLSKYISDAVCSDATQCYHFDTKEEAFLKIEPILKKGDSILVKASHGMEFPKVVDFLEKL